jgi:hypothetical protein
MTTGITAAAPAGFEVSADGLSYASSITFGAPGTIASTTISVRLAANTPPSSYSGNITLNSSGAQQQILSISSGTVIAKLLTVTGLTGSHKVYNGTTNATATGTAALSGVVGADDVSLAGTPVFTFASANAGTGIAITTTGYTLTGVNAGNYTLTQPSLSANITAQELTITGLTGDNKPYDGNTNANASGTAALSGVVGADDVSLAGTPVFTFASANVGTGIAITTTGYTLMGVNAGNYTLTQPSLSASIVEDPLLTSPENTPQISVLPGGGIRLKFNGFSGRTYAIQRSTTMLPGSWTRITTVTASADSMVIFDDTQPPGPSAFYRVAFPAQ